MHRAATNLPLLITVKKGGSRRDGGTLIVVLLWCCFSELDRYLKPDKNRAEELRKEFQAGFDGIASRIWPNLRIIRGRTTGMVAGQVVDTRMLRITTRSPQAKNAPKSTVIAQFSLASFPDPRCKPDF